MLELIVDEAAPPPHGGQPLAYGGLSLQQATAAMVLIHGRGASAQSILSLSDLLAAPGFGYVAPQAANNTWYPHSFLAPMQANEPGLSSGLAVIDGLVAAIAEAGIPSERVVLAGFSQGACLAAEYAARHPRRYGGLLVFSGGLIGPPGTQRNDAGTLSGTPVFLGCSDTDAHIPLERVHETAEVLRRMDGDVTEQIYPGMDHTIIQDEIDRALEILSTLE